MPASGALSESEKVTFTEEASDDEDDNEVDEEQDNEETKQPSSAPDIVAPSSTAPAPSTDSSALPTVIAESHKLSSSIQGSAQNGSAPAAPSAPQSAAEREADLIYRLRMKKQKALFAVLPYLLLSLSFFLSLSLSLSLSL